MGNRREVPFALIDKLKINKIYLTQQQMAELFNTTRNNITLHIGNIFKEGELEVNSVRKESLLTAADGKKYRGTKGRSVPVFPY